MFVFSFLYNIIAFIIVISVLVFVHELGHYLACIFLNVKVDSFSIGMGKEIYGWTNKRGERWKISLFPIGGYVMMYGDADTSSVKADQNLLDKATEEEKKTIIYFQPSWKKFIITFAGPFFSFMFAVLLFAFMYSVNGISIINPIVKEVIEDSPAYNILRAGDKIVSINNKKINTFKDITMSITLANGNPVTIKIVRECASASLAGYVVPTNNDCMWEKIDALTFIKVLPQIPFLMSAKDIKNIEYTITPLMKDAKDLFGNDIKTPFIGIKSESEEIKKINIFVAFWEGVKTTHDICKNTLIVLGQMLVGNRGTEGLGGPLKIAKYSAQSFSGGFWVAIYFMALLSANLGLMNLLPIPCLDGGSLFFLLLEMLTRKKIPEKIQENLLKVGFSILVLLMVFATFNDLEGFFVK